MRGKWAFPPNAADIDEGLSDAGIETFRDAPYSAIARECGQNSLDAALRLDDDRHERVELSFTLSSIPTHELPGHESLMEVIGHCLRRGQQREIRKEIEFFTRANALVSQPTLRILHIADEGTTGLQGPCIEGKPFHALVKASGVSNKSDPGAGGSFGIGKNAAFAVSELRTAFYSTIYTDGVHQLPLLQGKAVLTSFRDRDNNHYHARGFWGVEGFQPLTGFDNAPHWLARSTRGTTVTAIGFPNDSTWRERVAESLIRNFFAAISRDRIRFDVDGTWKINSTNLRDLFSEPALISAADDSNTRDDLALSSQLLRALTIETATHHEETFPSLGLIRLHILVEDGLPKRIGILRNGMYLTDNLGHFPSGKFKRFALQRDFVAVLEPADTQAIAIFRELENPKHDELSPERIEDRARRRGIASAFTKMIAWARQTIASKTEIPPQSEMLASELDRFFATPDRVDTMPDGTPSEADPERIRLRPIKPIRIRPGAGQNGDEGGTGGNSRNTTTGGTTSGAGEGRGRGGSGTRGSGAILVEDLRAQYGSNSDKSRRRISFTPTESGSVRVDIRASGMSMPDSLRLRSLNGKPVDRRYPSITVSEGERTSIDIQLVTPYSGPVDLVLTRDPIESVEIANETE